MADNLSVDTSSYTKPVAPPNPLDTVSKVIGIQQGQQNLQSGALTIDKQKLDLVNQRFGEVAKGLTALATDPNVDENKVRQYFQNQVKLGYMPPEMAATAISQLPPTQGLKPQEAAAAIKQHLETQLAHAQTVQEAINFHYGTPGTVNTGSSQQPVVTSPKFGIQSTGLPIQNQLPTGTPGFDDNGKPAFAPPNPNAVTAPPPRPGTPTVPGSAPTPLPIARPEAAPATFAQRSSFAPAPPPLFEKGTQAYTEDQAQALARATALKPAEQALKLLPGLRSGPTTEAFNKAVAALKANGIIDTDTKNDPTAIYQEVNKKLSQYVGNNPNVSRSDAGQALAEAGSPSVSHQISPALIKLTRDAIALDRVQIARPNAFEGNDYQNYGKHRATFPQSIDERAFGLGDLPKDEAKSLVKTMYDKYKKNPNDPEAKKFLRSYDIAKKQGFGTTGVEE
jgi:hypothetical protein